MALIHGGQLNTIQAMFSQVTIPWLDLSTGVSPFPFPVKPIAIENYQHLPQITDHNLQVFENYYQNSPLLITHGSQQTIQNLPHLWRAKFEERQSEVWIPQMGYREHAHAWNRSGFLLKEYKHFDAIPLKQHAILVVINPNNPTGELLTNDQLQTLADRVSEKHGWLIVDEAFMDAVPDFTKYTLLNQPLPKHVFVLRSLGKFFGLAGIRIGSVFSHSDNLNQLKDIIGPWPVSGPALAIANQALQDHEWQKQQLQRLIKRSHELEQLLLTHFKNTMTGTHLFKTLWTDSAPKIYDSLCNLGIYVRLCDSQNALRFGLPNDNDFLELQQRLKQYDSNN